MRRRKIRSVFLGKRTQYRFNSLSLSAQNILHSNIAQLIVHLILIETERRKREIMGERQA